MDDTLPDRVEIVGRFDGTKFVGNTDTQQLAVRLDQILSGTGIRVLSGFNENTGYYLVSTTPDDKSGDDPVVSESVTEEDAALSLVRRLDIEEALGNEIAYEVFEYIYRNATSPSDAISTGEVSEFLGASQGTTVDAAKGLVGIGLIEEDEGVYWCPR